MRKNKGVIFHENVQRGFQQLCFFFGRDLVNETDSKLAGDLGVE